MCNLICERLKTLITSNTINIEKKGIDSMEVKNINNYILLSNHDIKDEDRRYFVLDVQTHKVGEHQYWNKLYSTCFNKEVANALFSYFLSVDTKNFKPQDFPMTEAKQYSITKHLNNTYLFIKECYIKPQKDLVIQ